jgi:hypothetical protein
VEHGACSVEMSSEVRGQRIHVADVTNRSPRPVRDVAWRIKPLAVQDYDWEAALVGELVPFPGALEGMLREVPGVAKIPLIRAGEKWEFLFAIPAADHRDAKIKVRFTDDAGLHREIDHDLHLEKLAERTW